MYEKTALIHFDNRNDCHFSFLLLIHDPFISGFEPYIKLGMLFFTTEIRLL